MDALLHSQLKFEPLDGVASSASADRKPAVNFHHHQAYIVTFCEYHPVLSQEVKSSCNQILSTVE